MKKVLFLLALAVLVLGAAFAQQVGQTGTFNGQNYTVQEVRGDGTLVLRPVAQTGDFASKAWTQVSPSPFGTSRVNNVAFGNGVWVAVGAEGKIAYSQDARSWTLVPAGTAAGQSGFGTRADVTAIAFGNGMFIAGEHNGAMASSTDGRTWTAVQGAPRNNYIRAIAFGGNRWVSVGSDGSTAYSSDGRSWTAVSAAAIYSGSNNDIFGVAYGNNRFVIAGGEGKVANSTNGQSWTATANAINIMGSGNGVRDIVYGGNRFVAVGSSSNLNAPRYTIGYSSDGTSWTGVPNNPLGSVLGIGFGNNRYVIVGSGGRAATSTDAATWTTIANTNFGTTQINKVAYGNGMFVAVGNDGKIAWVNE